jgi:hypothetical protein
MFFLKKKEFIQVDYCMDTHRNFFGIVFSITQFLKTCFHEQGMLKVPAKAHKL